MNSYLLDRPDMVALARGFAEAVELDDCSAQWWLDSYFEVAEGGYALFVHPGGCAALTRQGRLCASPCAPSAVVCHLHNSLIQRRKESQREDA